MKHKIIDVDRAQGGFFAVIGLLCVIFQARSQWDYPMFWGELWRRLAYCMA